MLTLFFRITFCVSAAGLEYQIHVFPTPGWEVSSDFYFHTLNALEEVLTLVYFDTRGTGRSQKPPSLSEYTYQFFANDLDRLRECLNQEKILVMGHSQGGMHTMHYALQNPEGCTGLILLDTFPAFDAHLNEDIEKNMMKRQNELWVEDAFSAYTSRVQPQNDEEFADFLFAILPFYFVDQSVITQYQKAFDATTFSLAAMKGQVAVQLEANLLPELHNITVPVLLVVGSENFICSPLQSERIHLEISNSKLIFIQNSGHFPWLEQEEQFYSRVREGLQALNTL